jgi:hypothetical protein
LRRDHPTRLLQTFNVRFLAPFLRHLWQHRPLMTRKKVEQAAHDNFSRIVSLARGQSGSRNSGSKHGRVPINLSSRRGRFAPHLFILSSSLRAPSSKSAEVSPSIGSGKAKR